LTHPRRVWRSESVAALHRSPVRPARGYARVPSRAPASSPMSAMRIRSRRARWNDPARRGQSARATYRRPTL